MVSEADRSKTSRFALALATLPLLLIAFREQFGLIVFNTRLDRMLDPVRLASRSFSLWNPIRDMGSLEYQTIGFLFNFDLVFAIANGLAMPTWISERLYMGAVMAIALWGFVRLVDGLDIGTTPFRLIGGLAYAISPMILSRVGWRVTETFGAAMLPWVLVPLVRAATSGSPRRAAMRSGFALALIGGMNASVTLALLPAPLLLLLTRERGPRRASLIRWWLVSVVLATFWWMAGLYLYGAYTSNDLRFTETVAATTLPTTLFNVLRGSADWLVAVNGSDGVAAATAMATRLLPMAAIAALTALGLAGLASKRMAGHRWVIGLFAIGVAVIGGAKAGFFGNPLSGPYAALLGGPLNAFRNVYKFQALVTLPILIGATSMAAALTESVTSRVARDRARIVQVALASMAVGVVALAAFPGWKGMLARPGFREVPTEWADARAFLDQQSVSRALVLPGMQNANWTWGNTQQTPLDWGSDIPSAFRWQGPLGGPGNLAYLDAVEEQISRGGGPYLLDYLRRGGFSHVVVANDISTSDLAVPSPETIVLALQSSGLDLVASFGDSGFGFTDRHAIEIWSVPGAAVATSYDASTLTWLSGDISSLMNIPMNVFGDRPYLLARDEHPDSLDPSYWLITDGNQRSIIQFGRNRNNQSYILSRNVDRIDGLNVDDHRFVIDGIANQTTAELLGVTRVIASSTGPGPLVSNIPSMQPSNILDGDPATAWIPSRNRVWGIDRWGTEDPFVEVDLAAPTRIDSLTIMLALGGYRAEVPVKVRAVTDAGIRETSLQPVADPQVLEVVPGVTSKVRIEISIDSYNEGGDLIGIRELDLGTGPYPTFLEVPAELLGRFSDPSTAAPAWVFDRLRPALNPLVSLTSESEIRRIFVSPRPLTERVDAQGRARTRRAVIDLLDATPNLSIGASAVWGDEPTLAPRNLVDTDPSTPWIAEPSATTATVPRLTIAWAGQRSISEFTLERRDIDAAPTWVEIRAGDVVRRADVDADGHVSFEPISADSIEIDLHYDRSDGLDPVGTAGFVGLDIPAIADLYPGPLDRSTVVPIECGSGPSIEVAGSRIDYSASPTLGEVMDLKRVELIPCSDPSIEIPGGENRLVTGGGSVLGVDHVDISMAPLGDPVLPIARSIVPGIWHDDHRTIDIAAGDVNLVVVNEIFNRGWRATLGGVQLDAVMIDGWRQGFVVPAGEGGRISLEFAPDRTFRMLTFLGFGLLVALGVGALWPGRDGSDRLAALREGTISPTMLWVFVFAASVWAVGVAALLVPLAWLLRRRYRSAPPIIAAASFLVAAVVVVAGDDRLVIFNGISGVERLAILVLTAIAFIAVMINVLPAGITDRPFEEDDHV